MSQKVQDEVKLLSPKQLAQMSTPEIFEFVKGETWASPTVPVEVVSVEDAVKVQKAIARHHGGCERQEVNGCYVVYSKGYRNYVRC